MIFVQLFEIFFYYGVFDRQNNHYFHQYQKQLGHEVDTVGGAGSKNRFWARVQFSSNK